MNPSSQQIIDKNKNNMARVYKTNFTDFEGKGRKQRQSKRTDKKENQLFGGKLYLRIGKVSDLYRDIVDLYEFYVENKLKLSQSFPGLIRMSLRLLCETAAKDQKKKLEEYLRENFDDAKKVLTQDLKTTLSGQNVTESSIVQLLQTGAHNYQSSSNMEQTIAISIIVGQILAISHGQEASF